jgi:hypothetical protein
MSKHIHIHLSDAKPDDVKNLVAGISNNVIPKLRQAAALAGRDIQGARNQLQMAKADIDGLMIYLR